MKSTDVHADLQRLLYILSGAIGRDSIADCIMLCVLVDAAVACPVSRFLRNYMHRDSVTLGKGNLLD
jgi:hypothetical protein